MPSQNPQDAWNFAALLGAAGGLTPEQAAAAASGPVVQAPTATYYQRGGNQANAYNGGAPLSPEEQAFGWYNDAYKAGLAGTAANADAIRGLGNLNSQTRADNQAALNGWGGVIDWQDQQNVILNNQTQALLGQYDNAIGGANAFDWGNLGNYQSQIAGINAQNDAYMSQLGGLYGSMSQPLQSQVSWAGDLTSQAAQAYADPAAIAAQQQALGQLQGIAGGSLDVSLSGNEGYQGLLNYAHGGNQLDPMSVVGMKDLKNVYGGSLDIKPGQLDPQAYAAALDAMGKLKELSDPRVTDAERFIYEQSLQNQIQNDRANRQGVQSQLRQRGLSGAGQQIANTALANQVNSENALLTSLGANANAVQRAMVALQGYGTMSGNLNAQANQMAEANQGTRMSALGQMSAIGANVAEGNANRQFAATGQAAGLYESNAQNNANRRLSGAEASAQTAGQMREQSFNEAYSRGRAADQTAQFNREQSIGVNEFNSIYAQNERNAAWNRGTGLTTLGLQSGQINATNAGNVFQAGRATNADTFGRTSSGIQAHDAANVQQNKLAQGQTDRRGQLAQGQIGINNGFYNGALGVTGLGIQNTNQGTLNLQNFAGGMAGLASNQAQAQAATQATKAAGRPGPLGLWTVYDDDAGKGSGLQFEW